MAARFKKKPPGNDNKLLKLDKLTLFDFMCTICQSIYIEPVTLPCYHDFCLTCFNGTIENNALSCPLCRTRIGSWLRTASKQNNLVNIKLWDFIKENFPEEVKTKLNGGDIAISEGENLRKISAPGEIRLEYESEILKIRKEQQILEEKHSKETEKLIRELQEQEEREKEENLAKLRRDEQLARQLADTSRLRGHRRPIHAQTGNTSAHNSSRDFYKHLSNNSKASTLDSYLVKGSVPNGILKNGGAGANRPMAQGPSPELMSTTGRCGRFLKNFLNGKLWGSGVIGKPTTSKTEPKVWEPQQVCAGHSRELSVRSGVVLHHDSHGVPSAASRLLPCAEPRESMEGTGEPDTGSEDSLAQELCYFKPLHPAPINRFSGRTIKCTPIRPRARNKSPEEKVPEISELITGLEKLRRSDSWPHRVQSSFVCLLSVPASYIKEREELEKSRKCSPTSRSNHKSNRTKISPVKSTASVKICPTKTGSPKKSVNVVKKSCTSIHSEVSNKELRSSAKKDKVPVNSEVTPKKTSPRRSSRSSVKLSSNGVVPNDQVLTRSKRSISFGDLRSPADSTGKKQLDNQLYHSNKLKDKSMNGKAPSGDLMGDCIEKDDFKISIPSCRVLRGNRHLSKSKNDKMDHAITRRMSNLLAEEERNGEDFKHNNNHNEYAYNGVENGLPKGEGKVIKKNGIIGNNPSNVVLNSDIVLDNLDPSLLEEQRRIEEMIAQEKKDFALAKKLQKQLCRNGYGISTGYTMRTTTKRQATLGEMLPTPKKMKV